MTIRLAAIMLVTILGAGCAGSSDPADQAADSDSMPRADPTDETPSEGAEPQDTTGDEPADVAGDEREVLSSCSPVDGVEVRTVLEPTGPRPPAEMIDAALENRSDLAQLVESLESEGASPEDARHEAYAQVVGMQLYEDLQDLPGYVPGRIASPTRGEPFLVAFTGEVPDAFDPDAYDLGSYGLEVATGAVGFDEAFGQDVWRAAEAAGLRAKDSVDDIITGTVEVSVVDASSEQVADFEAALDDPDRVCLVRVPPDVPCDDTVIADAEAAAARQGEVIHGVPTSDAEAEEIRRSHLGLTEEASADKAAEEQRGWRVVTRDGVAFPVTMDAQPGRLSVTVCHEVVVDATVEWWDDAP